MTTLRIAAILDRFRIGPHQLGGVPFGRLLPLFNNCGGTLPRPSSFFLAEPLIMARSVA